mgnify:CR=1 FL=1
MNRAAKQPNGTYGKQKTCLPTKGPKSNEELGVRQGYQQYLENCYLHRCRICKYAGASFQDLKRHVWKKHNFVVHKCEYCQHISFDETDEFTHKLLDCQLRGAFKCETCSLQFEKVCHVQQHSAIHISRYSYRCFYCNYETTEAEKCSEHQKIHKRSEADYRCPYCAWNSSGYFTVVQHMMRNHARES